MLLTTQERTRGEVEELVARHGPGRTALLPILQTLMRRHRQVSPEAMQVLADALGLPAADVWGVVSFYAFLDDRPRGKWAVRLCRTVSCDMHGKSAVARQLENELGIRFGETTDDGAFSLDWANCMGMCDQGPALLVNGEVHTGVTPERVAPLLAAYRARFGEEVA